MASEQESAVNEAPEILTADEAAKIVVDYLLENQRKSQAALGLPDGYVFIDFWPEDLFIRICKIGERIPKEARTDFVKQIAEKISFDIPSQNAAKQFFPCLPRINEKYFKELGETIHRLLMFDEEVSRIQDGIKTNFSVAAERIKLDFDKAMRQGKRKEN